MVHTIEKPQVFHIFKCEALEVRQSAYGSVGELFSGEGIEAVWVKKQAEEIDPGWFSQSTVDLIIVMQGELRFEFEREDNPALVIEAGDMLMLPANTRCKAYRWPRDAETAAVFVAVYPTAKA
jgi:quercetin dioxygenase-like cupin family protein